MCKAWGEWRVTGGQEIRAAASAGVAAAGSSATVRRLQLLRAQDDDNGDDEDTDLRLSVWRPRVRYRRQCRPNPAAAAAVVVSCRRWRRDGDMRRVWPGAVGRGSLLVRARDGQCLGVALLTTSRHRGRKSRDARLDGISSAIGRRAARDYDVTSRRCWLYTDFYKAWQYQPSSY